MRKNRIKLSLLNGNKRAHAYTHAATIDDVLRRVKTSPRECFLVLAFFSLKYDNGEIPFHLTLKEFINSYPSEIIDFLNQYRGKEVITRKDFCNFDNLYALFDLLILSNKDNLGRENSKLSKLRKQVHAQYTQISVFTSCYAFFPEYGLSSDILFITPDFLYAAIFYYRGLSSHAVSLQGDIFNVIACEFLDKDNWRYELNWGFFISLSTFFSSPNYDSSTMFASSTASSLSNFLHRNNPEKMGVVSIDDFYLLAKTIDSLPLPSTYSSIETYDSLVKSTLAISLKSTVST